MGVVLIILAVVVGCFTLYNISRRDYYEAPRIAMTVMGVVLCVFLFIQGMDLLQ